MSAVRMQTVVIIMIAANVLPLNAASPDLLFRRGIRLISMVIIRQH